MELSEEISPIRSKRAPQESPQKFSAVNHSLQLKHETVEKKADSILGESPSPSRQVQHQAWNLISPEKFAIRLTGIKDRAPQLESIISNDNLSG